jgi:hypothetical protein
LRSLRSKLCLSPSRTIVAESTVAEKSGRRGDRSVFKYYVVDAACALQIVRSSHYISRVLGPSTCRRDLPPSMPRLDLL